MVHKASVVLLHILENVFFIGYQCIKKDNTIVLILFWLQSVFSFIYGKIRFLKLHSVDSSSNSSVNNTSEWFHQIAYQWFTFEPQPMIYSYINVKTKHADKAFYEVKKICISDVENGIDIVSFYSWTSSSPFKILIVCSKELLCCKPTVDRFVLDRYSSVGISVLSVSYLCFDRGQSFPSTCISLIIWGAIASHQLYCLLSLCR